MINLHDALSILMGNNQSRITVIENKKVLKTFRFGGRMFELQNRHGQGVLVVDQLIREGTEKDPIYDYEIYLTKSQKITRLQMDLF